MWYSSFSFVQFVPLPHPGPPSTKTNFGVISGATTSFNSPKAFSRSSFTIVASKSVWPAALLKNSISRAAPAMRFATFAPSSVPRPRKRASSASMLVGCTKRNNGWGSVLHALATDWTPCTSMSRTQTWPFFATARTAAWLVP